MSLIIVLLYLVIDSSLGVIDDGLAVYQGRKIVGPREIDMFVSYSIDAIN